MKDPRSVAQLAPPPLTVLLALFPRGLDLTCLDQVPQALRSIASPPRSAPSNARPSSASSTPSPAITARRLPSSAADSVALAQSTRCE